MEKFLDSFNSHDTNSLVLDGNTLKCHIKYFFKSIGKATHLVCRKNMNNHEIDKMLKLRSESADIKVTREPGNNSTSQNSLPRGEYLQPALSPKMNKNLVKLKPIGNKKGAEGDESFEGSLQSM
jgi:hypothetical protein